ncbi:oxygen-independent coproporphyrinogen III oxidase [Nitrospinaceae bacterium]|nr:oxygen-independent coproporphyrinogen III oxidase [Nitrospinaceae bacterium]
MENALNLNAQVIEKYEAIKGSFYTFYPHTGIWGEEINADDYRKAFTSLSLNNPSAPTAIYFHFPYCPKQCFFCQCYTVISGDYSKTQKVVSYVLREMDLLFDFFRKISFKPNIREVHFGGGSPSHLREPEINMVVEKLKEMVDIKSLDEFSIEIDPRFDMTQEKIRFYSTLGINRVSIGIQDFDPVVQKSLNRIHSPEQVEGLFPPKIKSLFKSVNVDLIYGLPFQTRETFQKTMETVKKISPDRIALCVLGYRPDVFKFQSVIKEKDLPSLQERTLINEDAKQFLFSEGYERIGIDHFSKPTDDLAKAKVKKSMLRNAMGYTPGRYTEMISFGPSAMGAVNEYYFQNTYELDKYYDAIDDDELPIFRGHKASQDDLIRRHVINSIILYGEVSFVELEEKFGVQFESYFGPELALLEKGPVEDGLLVIDKDKITLTKLGVRFQRQVCMNFDTSSLYKHSREFEMVGEDS